MLNFLKNTWNLLVQVGVWLATFVASMLLPPVSGVSAGEADPTGRLSNYTVFIIAALVGVSLANRKKIQQEKACVDLDCASAHFFISLDSLSESKLSTT
jgi:hypothetical protein